MGQTDYGGSNRGTDGGRRESYSAFYASHLFLRFVLAERFVKQLAMLNHESPRKRVSTGRNKLSRRDAHHSAFASLRSLGLPSSITPLAHNGKSLLLVPLEQVLRRTPT